jgi:hypothetical protein
MALSETLVRRAAAHIIKGRLQPRSAIGYLPRECEPVDVSDSMAIQDAVHELLTANGYGAVVGTKIGCTTKVMQDYLGLTHPCAGAIFDSTVHHGAGDFKFGTFLHVGVECEIAVKLGSDLQAAAGPHSIESVSDAVAAVFPAIEVVDDRYVDFVGRESRIGGRGWPTIFSVPGSSLVNPSPSGPSWTLRTCKVRCASTVLKLARGTGAISSTNIRWKPWSGWRTPRRFAVVTCQRIGSLCWAVLYKPNGLKEGMSWMSRLKDWAGRPLVSRNKSHQNLRNEIK